MYTEKILALTIPFALDVILSVTFFLPFYYITREWFALAYLVFGGIAVALPHACFCVLALKYGSASITRYIKWCLGTTLTAAFIISMAELWSLAPIIGGVDGDSYLRMFRDFIIAAISAGIVYATALLPISERLKHEALMKSFAELLGKGRGNGAKNGVAEVPRAPSGIALTAKEIKTYKTAVFVTWIFADIYVFQAAVLFDAVEGKLFRIVFAVIVCLLSAYCNRLSVRHMKTHINFEVGGALLMLGLVSKIWLGFSRGEDISVVPETLFYCCLYSFAGYYALQGALLLHRRLTRRQPG